MAYFLKKTNNKKGTYLQIYESYYDPERKAGAHRSYRPIGYVHELQATGIEDPISFLRMKSKSSIRSSGTKSNLKNTGRFQRNPRKNFWAISH